MLLFSIHFYLSDSLCTRINENGLVFTYNDNILFSIKCNIDKLNVVTEFF